MIFDGWKLLILSYDYSTFPYVSQVLNVIKNSCNADIRS